MKKLEYIKNMEKDKSYLDYIEKTFNSIEQKDRFDNDYNDDLNS